MLKLMTMLNKRVRKVLLSNPYICFHGSNRIKMIKSHKKWGSNKNLNQKLKLFIKNKVKMSKKLKRKKRFY